jgi:hypothetical protein
MKRRVGCVIAKDRRVVATGYNGTPRGLKNCNEGGCRRCNSNAARATGLEVCLCLHAEEVGLFFEVGVFFFSLSVFLSLLPRFILYLYITVYISFFD